MLRRDLFLLCLLVLPIVVLRTFLRIFGVIGSIKGSTNLSGASLLIILFIDVVFSSIYPQLGHLFQSLAYSAMVCCENVKPRQSGHKYNKLDILELRSDIYIGLY